MSRAVTKKEKASVKRIAFPAVRRIAALSPRAAAPASSGTRSWHTEVTIAAGNQITGMATACIRPYWDSELSRSAPCRRKPRGTSRFSRLLRPLRTNELLTTGTAIRKIPRTGAGAPQDFVWKEYKTLAECADEDEYYRQSFTLGFDPKIGDKLIGTEYDMQVNHDYAAGLDVGGIIIPITKADKISGSVKFMVLGPVNATWSDYVRRHPTFFRHTKWTENSIPLLNHVSSIMIRQLEIKVYSDGDTVTSTGRAPDNDVIYMSDTNESFTNKKDDLTFKISSDLTREECKRLGVSTAVKLSTPIDTATGSGVLTIYDRTRGVQAKAEQLYIDSYYGEYHVPRVVMEQKLADTGGTAALFNHYRHPAMDKEFFVQGMGRNLMEGRADMTLKEIG